MLLEGKRLLITGVLTPASIAFDNREGVPGAGRGDRPSPGSGRA
jgi:enoyl-[acyl-carrier-protein] reductase (NADH)